MGFWETYDDLNNSFEIIGKFWNDENKADRKDSTIGILSLAAFLAKYTRQRMEWEPAETKEWPFFV